MNKIIEITVSPTGETRVQTKGFTGSGCRDASRYVEAALSQQSFSFRFNARCADLRCARVSCSRTQRTAGLQRFGATCGGCGPVQRRGRETRAERGVPLQLIRSLTRFEWNTDLRKRTTFNKHRQ